MKIKEQRKDEAKLRQAKRKLLSSEEQLASLDKRGMKAKKERARLSKSK